MLLAPKQNAILTVLNEIVLRVGLAELSRRPVRPSSPSLSSSTSRVSPLVVIHRQRGHAHVHPGYHQQGRKYWILSSSHTSSPSPCTPSPIPQHGGMHTNIDLPLVCTTGGVAVPTTTPALFTTADLDVSQSPPDTSSSSLDAPGLTARRLSPSPLSDLSSPPSFSRVISLTGSNPLKYLAVVDVDMRDCINCELSPPCLIPELTRSCSQIPDLDDLAFTIIHRSQSCGSLAASARRRAYTTTPSAPVRPRLTKEEFSM